MTTHSETLLNEAKPSEILIVSMKDGITVVRRTENEDLLLKEVQDTGFGLGHYYVTGVLDDA